MDRSALRQMREKLLFQLRQIFNGRSGLAQKCRPEKRKETNRGGQQQHSADHQPGPTRPPSSLSPENNRIKRHRNENSENDQLEHRPKSDGDAGEENSKKNAENRAPGDFDLNRLRWRFIASARLRPFFHGTVSVRICEAANQRLKRTTKMELKIAANIATPRTGKSLGASVDLGAGRRARFARVGRLPMRKRCAGQFAMH